MIDPTDLTDEELDDLWRKLNKKMAQLSQEPVLHRPKREMDIIEQYHAVEKERDRRARVPLY